MSTGAGHGIGAAVARTLSEAGAAATLVARSAGEIEALASELRGEGLLADASTLAGHGSALQVARTPRTDR
ncbi:SDR family NAD(P)-dependent oxidoreductase [Salipiger sp.]|uniref:SDR family NAD(P)-dependent oxidoreductase n=1 Tax=Salipiger sp. TaxID=2078585 RepID=UPI003A9845E2